MLGSFARRVSVRGFCVGERGFGLNLGVSSFFANLHLAIGRGGGGGGLRVPRWVDQGRQASG